MKITIEEALLAEGEKCDLDFKQAFNPDADGDWLELMKDIVAMANSGGGIVLIGCLNNGHAVGVPSGLQGRMDPAVVDDKVFKYTGFHLRGLETAPCQKGDIMLLAIKVSKVEYPIPFSKVGTYLCPDGKQKTAFGQGSLYFRHNAKSEPVAAEDLREFVERRLAEIKEFWLTGIRQVVESPPNSRIAVLPSEVRISNRSDALPIQITEEMAARILAAPQVDATHPYRQKEVIEAVNARLPIGIRINSHDLLCVRRAHNVHRDLKYCYNMNWSSPRYSEAFISWLAEQHRQDPLFFESARKRAGELKAVN